jgi:hypothetical protein
MSWVSSSSSHELEILISSFYMNWTCWPVQSIWTEYVDQFSLYELNLLPSSFYVNRTRWLVPFIWIGEDQQFSSFELELNGLYKRSDVLCACLLVMFISRQKGSKTLLSFLTYWFLFLLLKILPLNACQKWIICLCDMLKHRTLLITFSEGKGYFKYLVMNSASETRDEHQWLDGCSCLYAVERLIDKSSIRKILTCDW